MSKLRKGFSVLACVILVGCSQMSGTQLSAPAHAVRPQVIQYGGSPTDWERFSAPNAGRMVVGPDKAIWFVEPGAVGRFDIATGAFTSFAISDSFGPTFITVGPDGAIWTCASYIERTTTSGVVTNYPTYVNCGGISNGPDGFVYFSDDQNLAIGKISSSGQISEVSTPETPIAVATGADGNVWFTEVGGRTGYSAVAKVDPALTHITEYKTDDQCCDGGASLVLGADGRLYTNTNSQNLRAIAVDGSRQIYNENGSVREVTSANGNNVWFDDIVSGQNGTATAGWYNVNAHKVNNVGAPVLDAPCAVAISSHVGPDTNVYFMGCQYLNVFIRRILTVTPPNATLSIGQTVQFSIAETNCACTWTVHVDRSSIATATQPSNGQFSVTGMKPGSTTVTVADQRQNVFPVSIVVQ